MTIERTDDTLVLKNRPYWLILVLLLLPLSFLVGVCMIAAMLAGRAPRDELPALIGGCLIHLPLMYLAARYLSVITLTLDRPAGTAIHRRASLLAATENAIPLTDIRHAHVETRTDEDGGGDTYRLVLVRRNGDIFPFTSSSDARAYDKRAAADAINEFLGVEGTGR